MLTFVLCFRFQMVATEPPCFQSTPYCLCECSTWPITFIKAVLYVWSSYWKKSHKKRADVGWTTIQKKLEFVQLHCKGLWDPTSVSSLHIKERSTTYFWFKIPLMLIKTKTKLSQRFEFFSIPEWLTSEENKTVNLCPSFTWLGRCSLHLVSTRSTLFSLHSLCS